LNRVIKILAAGSLPYSALIVMLGMAFYVGRDSAPATSKVVIAERSRVILEAVMDRPDMPKEKVAEEVLEPLKAILAHYQASGYVVLDTARDENGNYAVAALPNGARDITPELQKAVARVAESSK